MQKWVTVKYSGSFVGSTLILTTKYSSRFWSSRSKHLGEFYSRNKLYIKCIFGTKIISIENNALSENEICYVKFTVRCKTILILRLENCSKVSWLSLSLCDHLSCSVSLNWLYKLVYIHLLQSLCKNWWTHYQNCLLLSRFSTAVP